MWLINVHCLLENNGCNAAEGINAVSQTFQRGKWKHICQQHWKHQRGKRLRIILFLNPYVDKLALCLMKRWNIKLVQWCGMAITIKKYYVRDNIKDFRTCSVSFWPSNCHHWNYITVWRHCVQKTILKNCVYWAHNIQLFLLCTSCNTKR